MRSRKRFFIFLGIIFIAWLITIVFALRYPFKKKEIVEFSLPSDENVLDLDVSGYGIYVNGEKIGYSISKQERTENGYRISEKSFMNISAYGVTQEVTTYTASEADLDLRLKRFYSELLSGTHIVRTNGVIERDTIFLTIETAGEKKNIAFSIGDKPFVPASIERVAQEMKFKEDTLYHFSIFEPTSEKIVDVEVSRGGKEVIEYEGVDFETEVILVKMLGIESKFFFSEEGVLLLEKSPMGVTLRREPLENVEDFASGSTGLKIYETYAIYPKGSISQPRKAKHLVAQIEGIANGYEFPIDKRQQFDNGRVTITIQEPASDFLLQNIDKEEFLPFLEATPFIPCTDEEFISLANEIVGTDNPTVKDVHKIIDWVYKNIRKSPTFSVPYAKEVLQKKVGDCNEHTVLFSALARSIGIPTKVVVGIVYVDGAFYYHAWNEYYWGRWVAIDPTFGQYLADATHIKFEEGTLLDFIKVVKLVGQLNIKIEKSS
jgi:hypothetical protein